MSRPWLRILVLVSVPLAVGAAATALRVYLFQSGLQYGATAERAWNLGLAALVGFTVVTWYRAVAVRRAQAGQPVEMGGVMTAAAGALAFATAAFSAATLLAPNTPLKAAAPACPSAPVYGAAFFAQTVEELGGANARSGAGTGYPQVNRFPGGCTLGFDGYCIGEPIGDLRAMITKDTPWPDQRWLIVHRRDELVASGRVQSQSKESDLGEKPDSRCGKWGGQPPPKVTNLTVTPPPAGQDLVALQVESSGAVAVGYAVQLLTAPIDGAYPFGRIGAKANGPAFEARWNPVLAAEHLSNQSGDVRVAAVACLAPADPMGDPLAKRVHLVHGKVTSVQDEKLTDTNEQERLGHTACSVPS
jgi:hypothetical protein